MQHETSFPSRLGFDEYDVSNSYCEYVVEQTLRWLEEPPQKPFLLTTGFFETHRPYPRERYEPAAGETVTVPDYLPDTDSVREDLAEFYGSIAVADAAVGQLLDALEARGLDHCCMGGVPHRSRAGPATGEVDAVRRRHGHRDGRAAAATRRDRATRVRRTLQRGVDLLPKRCWSCSGCPFQLRWRVFRTRRL